MRELKFRLHDKNGNLIGYEIHEPNNFGVIQIYHQSLRGDFDFTNKALVREGYFIPASIKCINTGKIDKNGKEIYEGDICRILYTDWPSNTDDSISLEDYLISISHTGIVVFSDLSFQIEMYNNKFNDHSLYSMHYGENGFIEVIGNIYESNQANV